MAVAMRFGLPMMFAVLTTGSGWSAPAQASDYGCQVLLCLSNPGGPTQYAACVPPIAKLWRDLATGGSFPTCSEGGVARARTSGRPGTAAFRVTMTFADGSRQTYPLSGVENSGAGSPSSGSEQP